MNGSNTFGNRGPMRNDRGGRGGGYRGRGNGSYVIQPVQNAGEYKANEFQCWNGEIHSYI